MTDRDDWFLTASGRRMFVLNPDPEDIVIEDIAYSLARICRFGGHCRAPKHAPVWRRMLWSIPGGFDGSTYSVAQHSIMVADLVPGHLRRLALLHDATEAYLGDVIRPVKRQLSEYWNIEDRWFHVIAARFDLSHALIDNRMPFVIKHADSIALMTERRDLTVQTGHLWIEDERGYTPQRERIVPLAPRAAERAFLKAWERSSGETIREHAVRCGVAA